MSSESVKSCISRVDSEVILISSIITNGTKPSLGVWVAPWVSVFPGVLERRDAQVFGLRNPNVDSDAANASFNGEGTVPVGDFSGQFVQHGDHISRERVGSSRPHCRASKKLKMSSVSC
jgi:hypothetical protein